MEAEVWKFYTKTERTVYEVSNLGNTKQNGKLFIPNETKMKYKKCGSFMIHRMVAEAFVENSDPINKTHVDHIDGNRNNNRADNLRWVTQAENNRNPITRKRFSDSHKGKPNLNPPTKNKIWVNNDKENKLIYPSQLNTFLIKGYKRGRLL